MKVVPICTTKLFIHVKTPYENIGLTELMIL